MNNEHGTPESPPKKRKFSGTLVPRSWVGIALGVLLLVGGRSLLWKKPAPTEPPATRTATATKEVEVYEVMHRCITPCDSVWIDFEARIQRFNVPVRVYLPSGDSADFRAGVSGATPAQLRRPGYRRIISLDSSRLNTPIVVKKVTKVKVRV